MGRWRRPGLAWLVLAVYLLPVPALAQHTKAGVVTTLEGNVTAVRAVTPQPVPLKFKDDVYLQDRVVTGDQSFARLLLGGKAVISIRERSAVTITEIPGRSIVDIESGKIALSVARDRMQPGEVINIKTPNAVAGVRGTVVVAQVTYAPGPSGAREPTSNLWVIRGLVEAVHTNAQGARLGVPINLGANQSLNATLATATTGTFTADQLGTIVQGLTPTRTQGAGSDSQTPARAEAINTATALLSALVGTTEGEKQIALLTGPPPQIASADTLPKQTIDQAGQLTSSPVIPGGGDLIQQQPPPSPPSTPEPFTLPAVFSGPVPVNLPGTAPLGSFTDFTVVQEPSDGDLISIMPDANVTLSGPLLALTDSTAQAGDEVLGVAGRLASTSPAPLISLDPTTVTAPGNIVEIVGPSGVVELVGAMFKDVGGTMAAGASILSISNGGRFTGTASAAAPEPLIQLSGTTTNAGMVLSVDGPGSSADLTGSLLSTQGGSLILSGPALAGISQGGRVSSTSTLPFVNLVGTALALPQQTFVVSGGQLAVGGSLLRAENTPALPSFGLSVNQGGSVSVGGPVFELINTTATAGIRLVSGSLTTGQAPLIDVDGSTSFIAAFERRGANGNVLRLDTALLDATAPLIALTGAATRLQTTGNGIELANNARLQSTNAPEGLIRLENQARMDVLNGHLVSVSASRLNIAGDLVRMGSNTLLNVNGVLLNVLNGGVVNINGSLVAFTGANGAIRITNTLAPTQFIGGIPVALAPGANVSIGAGALAGLNVNGNTITINGLALGQAPDANVTGSLISVGANGTVRVGGSLPN